MNSHVRRSGAPSLSEHSVLAANFVPEHLRRVNEWDVTAPLTADTREQAASAGPKSLPVPFAPICYCKGNNANLSRALPLHAYPHRAAPSDLYYAVKYRAKMLHSMVNNEVLSATLPSQNLPSVENISSLDDYRSTWETILEAERKDVLLRYENYSQYAKAIEIHMTTLQMPHKATSKSFAGTLLNASIEINGIADGSPPLMIGDTVLVRPMHRVSLPLHSPRKLTNVMQWSPPIHVAEVQAKVLSVQRGTRGMDTSGIEGTSDKVVVSWLKPESSNILMNTLETASKGPNQYKPSVEKPVIFNIRFVPATTRHERCLTALDWLVETYKKYPQAAMDLLFPVTAPVFALPSDGIVASNDILAHSQQLNDKQANFVSVVLGRTQDPAMDQIRGPMVLTGPAGTGKTKTMLCAVHAVLAAGATSERPHRILVCTPSHTACDVVTRRLGKHLNRNQLFRLYAANRPVETVPADILGYCHQSDDQTGTFAIPDVPILMQFQVIVCTCFDAHILYLIGLTNQQLRERRRCFNAFLQKSCHGTNLECQLTGVEDPHFTHLFVDEAAQATEPEMIIALSVVVDPAGSKRKAEIALVGDPRQLSPSVYSSKAAAAGLGRSWMERLLQRPVSCLGGGRDHMLGPDLVKMEEWLKYSFQRNGQEQLTVFLTLNYRGHPSFLMMPSVLFYADKLQSMEHEKEHDAGERYWCEKLRHIELLSDPVMARDDNAAMPDELRCRKQFHWPLHFRGVVGKDTSVTVETGFASSSWENFAEAQTVVEICVTLAENGVSKQSIGVMSPFRGQVVLIRKLLRAKNLGGVNVGTIEDYQSVEHDVIVLSLTRSTQSFIDHDVRNSMGVFGQPKRSNVALTRAEFLFVVVGNPSVMVKDYVWRQFLLFCHRNGLYYGEQLTDTSVLCWNESKTMVRYHQPKARNSSLIPSVEMATENDTDIIAAGTLERLLRQ